MPAFFRAPNVSGPLPGVNPPWRKNRALARHEPSRAALTAPRRRASVPPARVPAHAGPHCPRTQAAHAVTIRHFRAAAALLPLAALISSNARAQGVDARTLQRGWVEFRAAGIYQQYNTRFADGGSEPLG